MNRATVMAGIVAAGLWAAPQAALAESAHPSGVASDFLAGTGAYDPNASGTKFSGTLTVVYDKETRFDLCPDSPGGSRVKNMYINITLAQGNLRVPFTTDYLQGTRPHAEGFCNLTNETEQVLTILSLIGRKAIPFLYNCDPDSPGSCPSFKIKSLTNFQATAGPLSTPTSGGFSADVTIASR